MPPSTPTSFEEITQISENHLSQNINLITAAGKTIRGKTTITTEELIDLPAYPPGLPLSTETINTSSATPTQTDEALTLGLLYTSNKNGAPQLPNITLDNWDLEGQEQLFVLLPKYLFTSCIITLQTLKNTTEKLKSELQQNRRITKLLQQTETEILETVRTLEFVFQNLQQQGARIIELIKQGQKLKQEIIDLQEDPAKEKELRAIYRQVQKLIGQFKSVTLTSSYAHQLQTIRPILKQISGYYEHFPQEVEQLTSSLITGQKPEESTTQSQESHLSQIKKSTATAIIMIMGAITGATITSMCYENCNTQQPHSFTIDK